MRAIITRAGVLALVAAAPLAAQQPAPGGAAYKYVLDYDVPESPAFAVLGLSPSNVLRASAAKPVAAQLLNQLASGSGDGQGIALDFAPWLAFGGGFTSVSEYNRRPTLRLLSRVLLSGATVQPDEASGTLRYGAGLRVTLLDSRDPLGDARLANDISSLLARCATAPETLGGGDEQPVRRTCDTRIAYDSARARAERQGGVALSAGFGTSGRMLDGFANRDSLTTEVNRAWVAFRWAPPRLTQADLLATAQWRDGPTVDREVLLGVAARLNTGAGSFAGELAYGSESGTLHPGLNAEFRILPRVSVIAAVLSDSDDLVRPVRRVRFRTNLRWNLSETAR